MHQRYRGRSLAFSAIAVTIAVALVAPAAASARITAIVPGATGATIHDNDLTGATDVGCRDDTTGGTGTLGTKNTWTDNTTSTPSSPVGLCGDS